MLNLAPFLAERHTLLVVFLIHIDQCAAGFDVIKLGLVDARMFVRFVDHFQPQEADENTQTAHEEEHMRPTYRVGQPAHDRGEDNRCEILCGVKYRNRRAPFLRREPGRNDSAVAGERRCFSEAHQEAQSEQRNNDAEAAKNIDEALQQGKHGPNKDGPEIDAF